MPPVKWARNDEGPAPPGTGGDRLGALPDALLHHVLSLLPAREAVQTCVLARRWRHLWKSSTGLRLLCDSGGHEAYLREFQLFVEHLLLLRGRAPLETFELRFDGGYNKYHETRINLWIRHVLMCQVRMMSLENVNPDEEFLLHPPIVSSHLTRLQFVGVCCFEDRFMDFSNCPSLEHLEIKHCDWWSAKKIVSMSLKCLSIIDCHFHITTIVYVPRLVSLHLDAHLYAVPALQDMPSLQEAFIRDSKNMDCCSKDCYSCSGVPNDVNKCFLLKGLSEAKNLALISDSSAFIFRCDLQHCPAFSKLKTLLLNGFWCVPPDFHELTCLLKHSPVLEKLTLEFFSKGPKHNVEVIGRCNPGEVSDTIPEHLKTIKIKCEVLGDRIHKLLKFLGTFNIYFLFK